MLVGVLISVLGTQASRIVPQPVSGSVSGDGSVRAGDSQSPSVHTSTGNPTGASSRPSSPLQNLRPLKVVSEDPLNVDDINDWIFPGPLVLSSARLKALNSDFLRDPIGNAVADYLYSHGGYEVQFTDTQLVVQNNLNIPVSIIDMRIIKSCTAPLKGTFFYAFGQAAVETIQLGFDLDSPDSDARKIDGENLTGSSPYYFAGDTVLIAPSGQQVFNLMARTLNHACTFRYQATVLEGAKKVYQVIGDGAEPFRVTGEYNTYSKYAVIYAGGVYSPKTDGRFVRVNPQTWNGTGRGSMNPSSS